jgi:mRNA interferase RelE/StbE
MGSALKGSKLGEFWKYRVGGYRIVCRIKDQKLLILVLRIGYRRELYR